ncbi:MAG: molybdate ABC transporter substrate-binding protein [Acidobacteriota bacterium]
MRPGILVAALLAVVAAASCGSDGSASDHAAPPDITVFAAASLTAAFTELGDAFTAANPGAEVTFSFAGSSELVAQLREGAPADVFASADVANMDALVGADLVDGEPEVFATNVAEIIVEAGNPRGVTGVADLADDDLVVVQCAPEVPCGSYAEEVLANVGVTVTPSSLEQNVKAVVTKVLLGEADAGIVYRTDVLAAGDDADGVPIPDEVNVVAEYPVALVADAPDPPGGRAFIDFVLSTEGQQILADAGFGPG